MWWIDGELYKCLQIKIKKRIYLKQKCFSPDWSKVCTVAVAEIASRKINQITWATDETMVRTEIIVSFMNKMFLNMNKNVFMGLFERACVFIPTWGWSSQSVEIVFPFNQQFP